jgi:hypothetical protein
MGLFNGHGILYPREYSGLDLQLITHFIVSEAKNEWNYTATSPYGLLACTQAAFPFQVTVCECNI